MEVLDGPFSTVSTPIEVTKGLVTAMAQALADIYEMRSQTFTVGERTTE